MQILYVLLVTFFAGMGAGLGTGFAGMSAAAVISPMLITFLGMDPYMAVGIALSSDVLASAVSAYTYHKNKNLDVKNGLIMMASVLGYELKTAVGTSVFIMTFTALTGAVSHFAIGGAPDWPVFALCVLFTLLWARIAAVFANKADAKTLNRATGIVLVVLGIVVMGFNLLTK